ncbi:MAG: hypothetical protein VCF07_13570 [Nitrospinota bacterium]
MRWRRGSSSSDRSRAIRRSSNFFFPRLGVVGLHAPDKLFFFFGERGHVVVESLDEDLFIGPLHGGERPGQPPGGVFVDLRLAAVKIHVRRAAGELEVAEPLVAQGENRHVFPEGVLPDAPVRREQVLVRLDEGKQGGAADLLLAFDDVFDRAGELPAYGEESLEGG